MKYIIVSAGDVHVIESHSARSALGDFLHGMHGSQRPFVFPADEWATHVLIRYASSAADTKRDRLITVREAESMFDDVVERFSTEYGVELFSVLNPTLARARFVDVVIMVNGATRCERNCVAEDDRCTAEATIVVHYVPPHLHGTMRAANKTVLNSTKHPSAGVWSGRLCENCAADLIDDVWITEASEV